MQFVQNWVMSIAAVTLIVSVITALCPKNAAGRAVSLASCLLMTATLLSPISRVDVSALSDEMEKYSLEAEQRYEKLLDEQENIKEKLIEENTRAYILQRAESSGIECDITVQCKEGTPYTVYITAENDAELIAASELVEKELGIARERQLLKQRVDEHLKAKKETGK